MPDLSRLRSLSLLFVVITLMQLIGVEAMRYQTELVLQDQWWRILTGHFVHANWIHYLLNLAGLMLCLYLTLVQWTAWGWLWRSMLLAIWISSLLLVLHPSLGWYVGFSGVLFGLFVLSAVSVFNQQPWISGTILLVIGGRVLMEQFSSIEIDSSGLIGVPVLVDAHFYGLVGGMVLIVFEKATNWLENLQSRTPSSGE